MTAVPAGVLQQLFGLARMVLVGIPPSRMPIQTGPMIGLMTTCASPW